LVTQTRNLRTGRSIWERNRALAVPHARLANRNETDVVVIGAGITGAMIADVLASAGLKVAVVDKRGPAKGSTTASTALVQYEIDTPLSVLPRKIGKLNAIRAWRRSRLAVDALAARFGELNIPDMVWRDTLYLAGDVLDPHGLSLEHDARQAAGLANRFLNRKALLEQFGIRRAAALLSYGNFVIDPRRTTLALLNAAADNGARIYAPVEIVGLDAKRSGVTITTANGSELRCRQLVFATGYELPVGIPRRGHKIHSTWVIATVAQPRRLWPRQCTIWEASEPYLYVRTTSDGRVICGGEDEEFSDERERDALLPRKTQILKRKLARLLPDLDPTISFAWTGTFGGTVTGLPRIGRVPGMPKCWVALGYGGNGISYARIAADVICGGLTGRPDVDADLFDFPNHS